MHLAFVTNNASRPPSAVAQHLRDLGIDVADDDVVTSAQAAARLLASSCRRGAKVFVIGGAGLEGLWPSGACPVQDREEQPVAVVSGFSADLRVGDGDRPARSWSARAALGGLQHRPTVPTPDGPGPGNGVLVGVVARFAERTPVVAGKPQPPLFQETLRRVGGERPLVVGDRLDTDIEGATKVGYDCLLVMTGVTGLDELVRGLPGCGPPTSPRTSGGWVAQQHDVG